MGKRPPVGSRWWLAVGSRMQPVVVLAPSEDGFGMVAIKTTRAYTTRDQWDYPVKHKPGEKGYVHVDTFASLPSADV